jgi:hypothetical protein
MTLNHFPNILISWLARLACFILFLYKSAKMLRVKNHLSTAAAVKMSLLRKPKGKESRESRAAASAAAHMML